MKSFNLSGAFSGLSLNVGNSASACKALVYYPWIVATGVMVGGVVTVYESWLVLQGSAENFLRTENQLLEHLSAFRSERGLYEGALASSLLMLNIYIRLKKRSP